MHIQFTKRSIHDFSTDLFPTRLQCNDIALVFSVEFILD